MITNEIPGKPAVAETFSPGQSVGENFTLKQKLSSGGDIGILWLAHDSEAGKDVSLLFLPAALLDDARVMEELRAQVKLNRQLIHPHVLRTHDFVEEEGWAAISSDPVEADTLASLLEQQKNGAFDPSQAQAWLSSVCQTLDDAHRAGLLHRDLVPRNILVAKDGKVLIANFGISRIILDALGRVLGRGKIDEHLASMSPQQLDGEYPARLDDIYALGALIYQLLTGKPPFHSGEILPQIRKTVPAPLSARRAEFGIASEEVPPAWDKVVAACLDKHTPQRPKSAREVGIKLGAEITLSNPVQPIVRPEAKEPEVPKPAVVEVKPPVVDTKIPVVAEVKSPVAEVKAPVTESKAPIVADKRETTVPAKEETAKSAPVAAEKPAETKTAVGKKPAEETKDSLVREVARQKPPQQREATPDGQPSFKHLLEKVPEEQQGRKPFPLLKVAAFILCAGVAVWIISTLNKGNTERSAPGPVASATPAAAPSGAAVGPQAKPTPQVAGTPSKPPVSPAPVVGADKLAALAQARKNVADLQNALAEKTKARQQAESDYNKAKSDLAAENTALDGMKKTAADNDKLLAQSQDDVTRAAADSLAAANAFKAAQDAMQAAQKAADEKAGIFANATKTKEKIAGQVKDQQAALQAETARAQALQKAGTDKQAIADAAGNAEQEAKTQLQQQQDLLKQAEIAAVVVATPAPQATGSSPAPSATPEFVSITGSNPTALQETQLVQTIQSHQPLPVVTPAPEATPAVSGTVAAATPAPNANPPAAFTNTLGMKFQPVGDVLFCVWLTRVQDFEVFAKETRFKSTTWLEPGFKQGPDHPVVYVSWNDAVAFCKWLTDKEHKSGELPANQSYRLPSDLEWSKAVGLPEETGKTPDERDVNIKDVYPWGTQWPPPPGAGNYDGEETDSEVSIKGYNDGYVYTSPVGAFPANKFGLFDMGGNAWEWCQDWYNGEQKQKVLRGASWYNGDLQLSLLSSCRWPSPPEKSSDNFGFRVVIVTEGKGRK